VFTLVFVALFWVGYNLILDFPILVSSDYLFETSTGVRLLYRTANYDTSSVQVGNCLPEIFRLCCRGQIDSDSFYGGDICYCNGDVKDECWNASSNYELK